MKINQHILAGNHPLRKVTVTYDVAVAGDQLEVAHGLVNHMGEAVTPEIYFAVPVVAAADGAVTVPTVGVVSADSTNVTLRCNTDGATLLLYVG